jgi:hypothetical protein
VSKNYQTSRGPAFTGRVTAKKTKASKAAPVPPATEVDPGLPGWALPSSVQVAMVDLAETAREGLLALALATGLQVMQVLARSDRHRRVRCAVEVDSSVRVAEYTSEFGRWDEVERASDPCLRPYVHGYFATSSSLVRPARERHLPAAEVPMVLNFGASHTRVDARSDSGPQRLDHAWVTGLQTHYHLSEAIGERRFMVLRFTPLGAHLFFHLSMDSLTDRAVPLEQVDPRIASLVSDHVMVARGWAERFDAMERLIGSRVAQYAVPPHIERAWNGLVRTWGQTPVGSLAADAGCSHRHLIQQFRTCIGLPPKRLPCCSDSIARSMLLLRTDFPTRRTSHISRDRRRRAPTLSGRVGHISQLNADTSTSRTSSTSSGHLPVPRHRSSYGVSPPRSRESLPSISYKTSGQPPATLA